MANPVLSKLFRVLNEEILEHGSGCGLYDLLKANDNDIRHMLRVSFLENLNDLLVIARYLTRAVEANDLYHEFVDIFDKGLGLLLDYVCHVALNDRVLTGWIQALQY